jgi:flagellin-like protein
MKRMLKSKKGISPILATLLLIVIAVAAVIVTYAWVMTFTGSTTNQAGAFPEHENTRFYNVTTTDYIEVTLRNTGTSDSKVETVYIGTSKSNLVTQTSVTYSPTTQIITAGESLTMTIAYDWTDGTTYYFKIATEEGLNVEYSMEA